MADWKLVDLCGAGDITRVCNVYELYEHTRLQGDFKIKVVEFRGGYYEAVANVGFKGPDGERFGHAGSGASELEALQDCIRWFMKTLDERGECAPEDLFWTDPIRF